MLVIVRNTWLSNLSLEMVSQLFSDGLQYLSSSKKLFAINYREYLRG
jgi:hypothetical protein